MVVTVTDNGRLLKPQTIDENGNIKEWLEVNDQTTKGSKSKWITKLEDKDYDWTKDKITPGTTKKSGSNVVLAENLEPEKAAEGSI